MSVFAIVQSIIIGVMLAYCLYMRKVLKEQIRAGKEEHKIYEAQWSKEEQEELYKRIS